MIIGSSRLIASPIASDFRSTPGTARAGDREAARERGADRDAPAAEISSSACSVFTPKFFSFESSCRMSDAGVIGYDA